VSENEKGRKTGEEREGNREQGTGNTRKTVLARKKKE
jgi:hypothetical protein